MKPEQIKGHLYALKVFAVLLIIGALFVASAMYNPVYLIWTIGGFFAIFTLANIYSILYEIGKEK